MFHVELMRIGDCNLWFNVGAHQRVSFNLCQKQKYSSFYVTNCGSLMSLTFLQIILDLLNFLISPVSDYIITSNFTWVLFLLNLPECLSSFERPFQLKITDLDNFLNAAIRNLYNSLSLPLSSFF